MPMFNTSNPFRSSSSSSSTQTSQRRGPTRKGTQPPSSSSSSTKRGPPPPDPRLVSLSQLDSATSRLEDLRRSFTLPSHLSFQPNSTPEAPKLEYSPNNAPFHAYDEALTKMLIELDGIDSCGGEMEIRTRRKGLVVEVEREIERLDTIRKEQFKRQKESREGAARIEGHKVAKENGPPPVRETQSSSSHSAPPPLLPPGLPIPPRDYPNPSAPSRNPFHPSERSHPLQPNTALPTSSNRRPIHPSETQPLRPPPAYRQADPNHLPRPSNPAWNSHNPYQSRTQ